MKNNWYEFWLRRRIKPVSLGPFYQNFKVMHAIVKKRYGSKGMLKSLEVGCGRGIISDFLHAFGWDTHCVDNYYIPPDNGQTHKFFKADAFDLPFPDHYFDLVFSYGLLEHFNESDQAKLVLHARSKTVKDGVNIHYVVPHKWTNLYEDNVTVYRDPCYFLRSQNVIWVYPAIKLFKGQAWETNKYLGKGFWYEDTGIDNSKID
jgi:SAM-dependent methyltransferase